LDEVGSQKLFHGWLRDSVREGIFILNSNESTTYEVKKRNTDQTFEADGCVAAFGGHVFLGVDRWIAGGEILTTEIS
jgi:hypothetical protein